MKQNASIATTTTSVRPYKDVTFNEYLTFCALGGLITSEDGHVTKMTLAEFCEKAGVNRVTTYRWKNNVANFSNLVRQRRDEIIPVARETAVWNRIYMIGLSSQDHKAAVEACKLFLGHFCGLKLPAKAQQPSIKQEGWAEILTVAKNEGIISG